MTDVLASPAAPSIGGLPLRPTRRGGRRSAALLALGGLLVVLGSLGSIALSRAADDRMSVLVVAHDLPAGVRLTEQDLVVARVGSDGTLAVVPESDRGRLVGQYLRVRLLQGQPLALGFLQAGPVVTPGRVVVALPVSPVQLPWGLHELSRVQLVVTPPAGSTAPTSAVAPVNGVVVRYPQFGADGSDTGALSVEVDPADVVPLVAAGRNVAVVLVDPAPGASS